MAGAHAKAVGKADFVVGRDAEMRRIRGLVNSVKQGNGGVLFVAGEAGSGRSLLAQHAVANAVSEGIRVLSASGHSEESDLPFAALYEVLQPLLLHLDALPTAQSDALRSAFALGPSCPTDRFVVYASALSLLLQSASSHGTVIVVDDFQKLDGPSQEALIFVARRVVGEPLGMLLTLGDTALGSGGGLGDLSVGTVVQLKGLDIAAVRTLVERRLEREVPDALVAALADQCAGNPQALAEVCDLLPPDAASDGMNLAAVTWPVPAVADKLFGAALDALSREEFEALVLVCVSGSPAAGAALVGAAGHGSERRAAYEALEAAGLISLQGREVLVQHPLIRSATVARCSPPLLRSAHRRLADAHKLAGDSARRAWHLAEAAFGADEETADALETAAQQAAHRSGYASAQALLEKAADLSPLAADRGRRLQRAGENARWAGDSQAAQRLLAACLETPGTTGLVRGEATRSLGRIEMFAGRVEAARTTLSAAAEQLTVEDASRAGHVWCEAAIASLLAQDEGQAFQLLMRAQSLTETAAPNLRLATTLVTGVAGLLQVERSDDAVNPLHDAVRKAARESDPLSAELVLYLVRQAWFLALPECRELMRTFIAELRQTAGLAVLPFALYVQAYLDVRAGQLASAAALGAEATRMARDTGNSFALFLALGVEALAAAWRGDEELCRDRAREGASLRPGLAVSGMGESFDALGHLELALGNYEAAVDQLDAPKRILSINAADPRNWSAGELAEALIRLDRPLSPEMAARINSYLDSSTHAATALAKRLRGMESGDDFSMWFEQSAAAYSAATMPTEQARTLLAHGERLRRAGDKRYARQVLSTALAIFDACGARLWARRAAQEIQATGLHPQRSPEGVSKLTPQEHQVASLVATGATNKEVALALFLSTKTVEAHLSRAYRKLGVRTRTQLAHTFTRSGHSTRPTQA